MYNIIYREYYIYIVLYIYNKRYTYIIGTYIGIYPTITIVLYNHLLVELQHLLLSFE